MKKILVQLEGGIGDVIFATPALASLAQSGHKVDLCIRTDFSGTWELFRDWSLMNKVSANLSDFSDNEYDYYLIGWLVTELIHFRNFEKAIILQANYSRAYYKQLSQADVYLQYARAIDSNLKVTHETYCGHSKRQFTDISRKTLVISPGCKKEYPMKRWDKFDELAAKFDDVVVIGTAGDLDLTYSYWYPRWVNRIFGNFLHYPGRLKRIIDIFCKKYNRPQKFEKHVKNYIGKLSLADTAALVSQAGCFVGNDGGLTHMAGALGIPTFMILGPTDEYQITIHRDNITFIKKGLDCQPCLYGGKYYPQAWQYCKIGCPIGMKCLTDLSVDDVYGIIQSKSDKSMQGHN